MSSRQARTAALIFLIPAAASAQVSVVRATPSWVGAPVEEYVRLLQLTGVMPLSSRMIRPSEQRERWLAPDTAMWRAPWAARYHGDRGSDADSARVALRVFDPDVRATYNSDVPNGFNDGAMWAGRGTSARVTAGAEVDAGVLRLRLAPSYTWSENQPFELGWINYAPVNASPYSDPWWSAFLDRPQRFGDRAVSRVDWGQSAVEASYAGVRAGWSNENMWWGPGVDNALLITDNAPGFEHAYLGTSKPANVGIGRLDAFYTVGWLRQSNFWRTAPDTFSANRWVNGLAVVFEPRGSPGLYLGAARLFYTYDRWHPITPRTLLWVFHPFDEAPKDEPRPLESETRDAMTSVWLRWVLPSAGFELYGEYGRNGYNVDDRDLALEPEYGRAYQIGLHKVVRVGDGVLSLRGELTNLTTSVTSVQRGNPTWYIHYRVRTGFTQQGQLIGAGIGPGGDAQTLAVNWFERRGRIGFTVQRWRQDTDILLSSANPGNGVNIHDAHLEAGPRVTLFSGPVTVDLEYRNQYEFNRYTVYHQDQRNQQFNLRLQVATP